MNEGRKRGKVTPFMYNKKNSTNDLNINNQ